jgi:hypothetical protein
MVRMSGLIGMAASGSGSRLSRTRPSAGAPDRFAQLPVDARSRRRLAAPSQALSVRGARGARGAIACGFRRGVKIHLSTTSNASAIAAAISKV